jgi:hypothetical protein
MLIWIIIGILFISAVLVLTYYSIQTLISIQNFLKTSSDILQNRDKQIEQVLNRAIVTTEKINEAADTILFLKNLIPTLLKGSPIELLSFLFKKKKGEG